MKKVATCDAFLAIVAVIAALVPFLNKAFHIDDPLFLWMAQQVSQHPADPYGFFVNWYVSAKPMFSIMQNPPLNAYYIALAAKFLGWTELAMHGAFLVPAVAAAALTKYFGVSLVPLLAVYTVARERRLTSRLLFLLIPIVSIGIYEAIAKAKYGQGLFTNAMVYPWQGPVKAGKQLSGQFLI